MEVSPALNVCVCVVDVLALDAKGNFCNVHSHSERPIPHSDTIVQFIDHVPPNITSSSNRV